MHIANGSANREVSGISVITDEIACYIADCAMPVIAYGTTIGCRSRNIVTYEIACYIADCTAVRIINRPACDTRHRSPRKIISYEIGTYVSDTAVRICYCSTVLKCLVYKTPASYVHGGIVCSVFKPCVGLSCVVFCGDLGVLFVGFGELEAVFGVFPFIVLFSVAGAVFGLSIISNIESFCGICRRKEHKKHCKKRCKPANKARKGMRLQECRGFGGKFIFHAGEILKQVQNDSGKKFLGSCEGENPYPTSPPPHWVQTLYLQGFSGFLYNSFP